MSSLLEPPSNKPFIFQDTLWLGGKHDGYRRVPFEEYVGIRPEISPDSSLGSLAVLQTLLTFGLLEAVMEVEIAESELLRVDSSSGMQTLTSENLPALLRDWRLRIQRLNEKDSMACGQWASRVQTTLEQAYIVLNVEASKVGSSVFEQAGLEPRVLADIVIQIGSVAEAVQCSCLAFPETFAVPLMPWDPVLAAVAWQQIADEMFANGWCPFTVESISDSVCMLGYARTCKHIRGPSKVHGECTPESCVLNKLDTSHSVAKHIAETCNCDWSKPPLESIVGSLLAGKIPVVQCPPPHNELRSNDSTMPYVAISHVWADGLTSTTEKGLPSCQIKRLAAMASEILKWLAACGISQRDPECTWAFWIDALCIPKEKDVRELAIGLMAQTYKDAKAVLVIDSVIREISSSAPREEKLLYVLSSKWMQRLWTFQEAALARKLIFEFSDGLVALEQLVDSEIEDTRSNPALHGFEREVYQLRKYQLASSFGIGDVARSLCWRTTSRESDETLAVSGLLNLDALELARLPPEERMKTFLLRIGKLPREIIMLWGRKLNQPGFRWAPSTFMRGMVSNMRVNSAYCDALCTSTGLEAEYDVILIQDMVTDKEEPWVIHDLSNQRIYRVQNAQPRFHTSYSCNAVLLLNLPEPLEGMLCGGVLRGEPDVVPKDPVDGADRGENFILCEFKNLLFLEDITEAEMGGLEKVNGRTVNAKSARMRVKVM